jgi:acyl-coenzyme A thioesterase PaaI-like protein
LLGQSAASRVEQAAPVRSAPSLAVAPTERELERLLDGQPVLKRMTGASVTRSAASKAEFEDAEHSLIHGHVGPGEFERFDVWIDAQGASTFAIVRLGDRLCGHRGIVHGGATAAVCDELFGWTAHHCGPGEPTRIFTAYLHIDYKAPLIAGTPLLVATSIARVEGRKLFLESRVQSLDGGTVYATGNALFVIARDDAAAGARERATRERTEGTPVY